MVFNASHHGIDILVDVDDAHLSSWPCVLSGAVVVPWQLLPPVAERRCARRERC